jgi:hypothetical protein
VEDIELSMDGYRFEVYTIQHYGYALLTGLAAVGLNAILGTGKAVLYLAHK